MRAARALTIAAVLTAAALLGAGAAEACRPTSHIVEEPPILLQYRPQFEFSYFGFFCLGAFVFVSGAAVWRGRRSLPQSAALFGVAACLASYVLVPGGNTQLWPHLGIREPTFSLGTCSKVPDSYVLVAIAFCVFIVGLAIASVEIANQLGWFKEQQA